MNTQRNGNGQFIKGHPGFKPKGAKNWKTRQKLSRMEQLANFIDQHLEEDILCLSHKERIKLWYSLVKTIKMNHPEEANPIEKKEVIDKIIFEIVHSNNSIPSQHSK
jgi:hypothetical protein